MGLSFRVTFYACDLLSYRLPLDVKGLLSLDPVDGVDDDALQHPIGEAVVAMECQHDFRRVAVRTTACDRHAALRMHCAIEQLGQTLAK